MCLKEYNEMKEEIKKSNIDEHAWYNKRNINIRKKVYWN